MKAIALCQMYSPDYEGQLASLRNIIKTMLNDDEAAKAGIYKSVIIGNQV